MTLLAVLLSALSQVQSLAETVQRLQQHGGPYQYQLCHLPFVCQYQERQLCVWSLEQHDCPQQELAVLLDLLAQQRDKQSPQKLQDLAQLPQ